MTPDEIKAALFAEKDRTPTPMEVPEWPKIGTAWFRPFGGDDRDAWDQVNEKKAGVEEDGSDRDLRGLRAWAVARAWCTESGEPVPFTEAEVVMLGEKSGKALQRCFALVCHLSGIGAGAYEAAKKN